MHPVFLRWGSHVVYWYSALIWLGLVSALGYALWQAPRAGFSRSTILDAALCLLAGGLLGARAAYVIPNWTDYGSRPEALLGFWGGGYSFQGGLFGGALGLWLYALVARQSFPGLADLASVALSLGQSIGWAGAWVHGANYGLVVRSTLSMWLPDLYGVYGPRIPVQMLACLLGMLISLRLHGLRRFRLPGGLVASVYLLCNGILHFVLEFMRADETLFVGPLRWTQVAELAEVMLALGILLYLRTTHRAKAREKPL
jgi:phosphatidylglycerol:prolipoprotein diacylglycerol transferase